MNASTIESSNSGVMASVKDAAVYATFGIVTALAGGLAAASFISLLAIDSVLLGFSICMFMIASYSTSHIMKKYHSSHQEEYARKILSTILGPKVVADIEETIFNEQEIYIKLRDIDNENNSSISRHQVYALSYTEVASIVAQTFSQMLRQSKKAETHDSSNDSKQLLHRILDFYRFMRQSLEQQEFGVDIKEHAPEEDEKTKTKKLKLE